jgi:hypothetical protein
MEEIFSLTEGRNVNTSRRYSSCVTTTTQETKKRTVHAPYGRNPGLCQKRSPRQRGANKKPRASAMSKWPTAMHHIIRSPYRSTADLVCSKYRRLEMA